MPTVKTWNFTHGNSYVRIEFCSDNRFPLSNVKALVALLTLDSIVFYRCHAPLHLPKSKLRSYLVNTFHRFPPHGANYGPHVLLISNATRQIQLSTPWSGNYNRFLNSEFWNDFCGSQVVWKFETLKRIAKLLSVLPTLKQVRSGRKHTSDTHA